MATCAVSTVKNEPKTTLKTKIANNNPKNETRTPAGPIFALLNRFRQKTRMNGATLSLFQNSPATGWRQSNMLDDLSLGYSLQAGC
jgi:hypothetical protein